MNTDPIWIRIHNTGLSSQLILLLSYRMAPHRPSLPSWAVPDDQHHNWPVLEVKHNKGNDDLNNDDIYHYNADIHNASL